MSKQFNIQEYLSEGIECIVSELVRNTLKNPKESLFMLKFASASSRASKKRALAERKGKHIPPFLIASITSSCNLHCEGCYSRCNNATVDNSLEQNLASKDWCKIFDEADEIGISFILLAGGEPLIRRDVIEMAGKKQNIFFPIFTNGTYMDEKYFKLFDDCRNLFPVMSIEGNKEKTDKRRGDGVFDKLIFNMNELNKRNLIYGVSITVTTENISEVTSFNFIKKLSEKGCKMVIYVEYVPVSNESKHLAISDEERIYLKNKITELRKNVPEAVFISFPGDEKDTKGCIAAGRGFFHINSKGYAEPCPFSPYSDTNVKDTSLLEAINSKFFKNLRNKNVLNDEHIGGCVLFEKKNLVEEILKTDL